MDDNASQLPLFLFWSAGTTKEQGNKALAKILKVGRKAQDTDGKASKNDIIRELLREVGEWLVESGDKPLAKAVGVKIHDVTYDHFVLHFPGLKVFYGRHQMSATKFKLPVQVMKTGYVLQVETNSNEVVGHKLINHNWYLMKYMNTPAPAVH